ncbi:hypothetical protein ACJX0J_027101, partial [Zea mays]
IATKMMKGIEKMNFDKTCYTAIQTCILRLFTMETATREGGREYFSFVTAAHVNHVLPKCYGFLGNRPPIIHQHGLIFNELVMFTTTGCIQFFHHFAVQFLGSF